MRLLGDIGKGIIMAWVEGVEGGLVISVTLLKKEVRWNAQSSRDLDVLEN